MHYEATTLNEEQWAALTVAARECRERAYILENTKVGAAAMEQGGRIFVGCNVEHRYRSHDVHAEVNAITSMVAAGYRELVAVVVVAERELFTPCGACVDWIFQFGGPSCMVAFQAKKDSQLRIFRARELMPYYPM